MSSKVVKPAGVTPSHLELQVAQSIADLEQNVAELKADLRGLHFTAAKQVPTSNKDRNRAWPQGNHSFRPCSVAQSLPQSTGQTRS